MRLRILIYLVLGVLITPIALAGISLEGFNTVDYNIGDNIIIGGRILYNDNIEGRLNIDLVCSENVIPAYFYLVDLNLNEAYDFLEGIPARESMLGYCYFWIKLSNDNGNLLLEKTSEKIHVTDQLKVTGRIDGLYKNPGEILDISGEVKKANGLNLKEGILDLVLDDNKKYPSKVKDGLFDYKLTLDTNIKSGKHKLSIITNDGNSNNGKIELGFDVNAIPKDINVELSSSTVKPGDVLNIKTIISDQAGDLLSKGINMEIYDPDNQIEYRISEVSDNTIEFEIPEFAVPGVWKSKVVSGNLFTWKEFNVQEVKNKEVKLEGDILIIRNIGNVDYSDDVQVDLAGDGKSYSIIRKTSLKPNQTISIDLTKEVPAGDYKYEIGGSAITGNVVLERGVMELNKSKLTGYAALVFVLIFLMFIIFSKGKRVASSQRERERAEGRKRIEELRRISNKNKPFVENKVAKEDIDFLIKKVQESEDKKDKFSNFPSFE